MPRARITREKYDLLIVAFREEVNVVRAARLAGVGDRTARRAWHQGWDRPVWARPIKFLVDQDQVDARARMEQIDAEQAARLRDEKQMARIDAAKERAREAQAVRGSLNTSLMLLGNIGQFSRASVEMCKVAAQDLMVAVNTKQVSYREALKILSNLALVSKRASEQLTTSMEALRKHLGEPEKVLGFVGADAPSTYVDGEGAINRLGEENLRKAILDLASGEVDSPEAQALIEYQVDQATSSGEVKH